jgi:multicomponent K+:H+ antiporter subunit E
MTLFARLIPQPYITLAIIALWLALAPRPSLGHLLLGATLGTIIPWLTVRFWYNPPALFRPARAVSLFIRVVGDILIANWQVARQVLGPLDSLRPSFVEIPLDIDHPFVATLLGSIVSLTPGTVSIDIDRSRKVLLVHALDVADKSGMIRDIKTRYETPLKEIFGC